MTGPSEFAAAAAAALQSDTFFEFRKNVIKTYGREGQAWLARLPELVDRCFDKWSLKADGQFEHLTFNFVLPVTVVDGARGPRSAVLKLGPHLRGRQKENQWLKIFQSKAVVEVFAMDSEIGALLLERAEPGVSLREALAAGELSELGACQVFADLYLQLNEITNSVTSGDDKSGPSLQGLTSVEVWGLGFEKFLREDCRGVDFPRAHVQRADQIFKELVRTTTQVVALHGDLHHSNILKGSRQQWQVIDPKGLAGDLAFEVGAFMRNPFPEVAEDPRLQQVLEARLRTLSTALQLDLTRMQQWSYCQAVLAAIWTVEDSTGESAMQDWRRWLRIAEALR